MGALVSTGPEAALLFGTFTRTKTVALRAPVGDFIAVPRVPAQLRAILAPHVTFKLVYRRCLWTPNNVERNRLACVAPEASHLKIEVTSVQCVTLVGEGCAGPLKPNMRLFHAYDARKSTGGIWWSSDMIAPKAFNGKPLGFERVTCGPTGRRGCG